MPLYAYRCRVCKKEFDEWFRTMSGVRRTLNCPKCYCPADRIISPGIRYSFKTGDFFEPYIDEDIHPDGKPIKIETKQDFFRACEKHGRGYRPVRDKLR